MNASYILCILTLECLQISTKWKFYMFIFAIWRRLIYELFNASLFRNHAGIRIQKFLPDSFLNDLPVSNSHPEATLSRVVSPSRPHEQRAMRCGSLGSPKPSPRFLMPLWNVLQAWFYDERCTPDSRSWSKLPCSFTKSIAKKLSANEMSSSGASLALGNVHREDVLGGIQTSSHLWSPASLRAGPFGTGHTAAFSQARDRLQELT